MSTVVQMRGICKEFSGVVATKDIDLEIRAGEILGLLGENGAGKTTLMNILYGITKPDSGQIFVRGEAVRFNSPHDAIERGIGMVHQHFMLIPAHTVLENIILASREDKQFIVRRGKVAQLISELSATYGLEVDPRASVGLLPLGIQQRVEITKALYNQADLLILDEPTGVLTPQEAENLMIVLRRLASEGSAIVFITHKLEELLALADRIVVLRGGKNAGEVVARQTNALELARMMVGREFLFDLNCDHDHSGEVYLKLKNVSTVRRRGLCNLKGISFDVRAGEIVGVAGIAGNGQSELAEAVLGLRPFEGSIEILGRDIRHLSPSAIHRMGVGTIPEDRNLLGLVPDLTIEENLALGQLTEAPISRHGILQPHAIRTHALRLMHDYAIRASGPDMSVQFLSGGNQQKVLLARAIAHSPKVLVVCQPTRGLDVSATQYVRQCLADAARDGCSILLISTELDEIMMLSSRILVLYEGRVMGDSSRERMDSSRIGLMMAGARSEELCI